MKAHSEESSLRTDSLDEELTPESCDLAHWFSAAASRFAKQPYGHDAAPIPPWMMKRGPLREALLSEFAFRARTEESATRKIGRLVQLAPSLETMDFYATQLIDEARHAHVFRSQLVDLGLDRTRIANEIAQICADDIKDILEPLEAFTEPYERTGDFIGGVVILTIIAEGALAPAAEMSLLKWRVVHPRAAQVAAGANWDEVRHLAVGSNIVREHVRRHPSEKRRLEDLIRAGMDLWQRLPISMMMIRREQLFQEGIEGLRDELRDVELLPNRLLIETTVQERLMLQFQWSQEMRSQRLRFMGLDV